MAWEKRERGGTYYTRSRRESGRVVREYVGGGEQGELEAERDAAARQQAATTRTQEQTECEMLDAIDAQIAVIDAATDALLCHALTGAGYHQHHRGEWRKRREREQAGRNDTDK